MSREQWQREEDEHMETIRSVRVLEEAVAVLFQNNFDADSKICLITLMKILDNVLHQPGNPKVRTIRLANKTFHQKVGRLKGGVDFLCACGFQLQRAPPPLLSGWKQEQEQQEQEPTPMDTNENSKSVGVGGGVVTPGEDDTLVLPDHVDDIPKQQQQQSHLIVARRLLLMRAVQDLGMKADEVPAYRPPPTIAPVTSTGPSTSTTTTPTTTTTSAHFDPYKGHRYDAKSAAVGTNLGPDANYVSKTEQQLQALNKQRQQLEEQAQQQQNKKKMDRQWKAFWPNEAVTTSSSSSSAAETDTTSTSAGSDSALLAKRLQQQQAERKKREEGGFTTKAMRDLERLQKLKVYSHVAVQIQFPDGIKLCGQFVPNETIQTIKETLQQECFITSNSTATATVPDLELYVTPPRRLLRWTATLTDEGLVPAAKIFVRWTGTAAASSTTTSPGWYLHPSLFGTTRPTTTFPTGQPVVLDPNAQQAQQQQAKSEDSQKNDTKLSAAEREEELVRRMLGGSSSTSRTANNNNNDNNATNKKKAKDDKGGGMPKWFKR